CSDAAISSRRRCSDAPISSRRRCSDVAISSCTLPSTRSSDAAISSRNRLRIWWRSSVVIETLYTQVYIASCKWATLEILALIAQIRYTGQPMLRTCLSVIALASLLHAQWPDHRTPSAPRTPDGRVNLSGPAPVAADGHPDLSGVWD